MPQLINYIQLLRPHQYIKNTALFFPLFFAMRLGNMELLGRTFLGFLAFSLCASGIYILNDYRDLENDRNHPRKKNRPLASGAVSPSHGLLLMAFLIPAGFLLMTSLSGPAALVLLCYVLMNIAYCYGLKKISILDITTIAIGFVLRLFIGAAIGDIPLSMWIIVITFLLALFMALAKRRDDVLVFLNTGQKMRKSVDGYTLEFVDSAMAIMAAVVIVSYLLYTTSAEIINKMNNDHLYLTAIFVVLGVMRYLQIAFVEKNSGSPTEILLHDHFMQLNVLGWILSFYWILYG